MVDVTRLVKLGIPVSLITIIVGMILIHETWDDPFQEMIIDAIFIVVTLVTFAAIAVWRQIQARVDKIQKDADECGRAYRACIDARARSETRADLLERRLAVLENGHRAPQGG